MKGYSSSKSGHLERIHFDRVITAPFLHYTCVEKCKKNPKCKAITFRGYTNDCWLKSTEDYEPKQERSFVQMRCLIRLGNIMYAGYNDYVKDILREQRQKG